MRTLAAVKESGICLSFLVASVSCVPFPPAVHIALLICFLLVPSLLTWFLLPISVPSLPVLCLLSRQGEGVLPLTLHFPQNFLQLPGNVLVSAPSPLV